MLNIKPRLLKKAATKFQNNLVSNLAHAVTVYSHA